MLQPVLCYNGGWDRNSSVLVFFRKLSEYSNLKLENAVPGITLQLSQEQNLWTLKIVKCHGSTLVSESQIICGSHYCSLYCLASSTIMNFYQAKLHVANQGTKVRFALICLLPHHRSRFFHFDRQERPVTLFPQD
ncbi:hypothetical protein Peur_015381 [Populus x canadensis]